MKKFEVEITETLQRTVTVEAASQEEAERMVDRGWSNGDYVLTDEDYVGVDFKTVGEQELSEKKMLDVLLVKPNEHECEYDENEVRRQRIDIYYSFVGKIDLPEE